MHSQYTKFKIEKYLKYPTQNKSYDNYNIYHAYNAYKNIRLHKSSQSNNHRFDIPENPVMIFNKPIAHR